MTSTQRNFQPPPPQPAPQRQLGITGKIIFPPGPWGSSSPARTVGLIVKEGWIEGPSRPAQGKSRLPKTEMVLMTWGERMKLHEGDLLSTEVFTNSKGEFRIYTRPMSIYTSGLILKIRDYSQVIRPWDDIPECVYELIPGPIDMNFPSDQGVGTIKLPWFPALTVSTLARVNSSSFVDTQKLSRNLSTTLKSPAYPVKITLTGQAQDPFVNYDGLTHAMRFFDVIEKGNLPADFPDAVLRELGKIPSLTLSNAGAADAIGKILERFVTLNTKQLETGAMLNPMLTALNAALGGFTSSVELMEDAPTDMAACGMLLLIAGLMAKDNAKPTVVMGSKDLLNNQKIMTIDVSITK